VRAADGTSAANHNNREFGTVPVGSSAIKLHQSRDRTKRERHGTTCDVGRSQFDLPQSSDDMRAFHMSPLALSVKLRRSNIVVAIGGIPDIDGQVTDASPGANDPYIADFCDA
jgi:hypothetical protein